MKAADACALRAETIFANETILLNNNTELIENCREHVKCR
jgi:hypothetical protein